MIIERKEGMKRPLHYKTYLPTHIPNRQARVLVLRGVLFAAATAARCLTPPPLPPPSRRNGAGKHYRVCMHSVIGRHLTPCSCCCCHLAAGTQNFMLMASEADNGNLNGTQSDLLATWLGFCIRRLLFYIWMSCDDDGKGSRQPAGRPPSWPFTVTKLTQNPFVFSKLIPFTPRSGKSKWYAIRSTTYLVGILQKALIILHLDELR